MDKTKDRMKTVVIISTSLHSPSNSDALAGEIAGHKALQKAYELGLTNDRFIYAK